MNKGPLYILNTSGPCIRVERCSETHIEETQIPPSLWLRILFGLGSRLLAQFRLPTLCGIMPKPISVGIP